MTDSELTALLDAHDALVKSCVDSISPIAEFLALYNDFPHVYALDGHETTRDDLAVFQRSRKRDQYHRILQFQWPLWQPVALTRPESESVQVALHLRLHLIELVGRITGDVALNVGTRQQIRSAEELLAVLVDHLEIEIFGGGQSLSLHTFGRFGCCG
jgi:hypothetical protein